MAKKASASASKKSTRSTRASAAANAVSKERTPASSVEIKKTTIEKAVSALSKWNENREGSKEKADLLADDDEEIPLLLQVSATKFFSDSKVLKMHQLSVPHPTIAEDASVCVITKDGLISKELMEEIEDMDLPHFGKIITVHDLKTTYKPYQSRRKLQSEFDIFLVDSNIVPMMPKLLGKIFYQRNKLPQTIKMIEGKKFNKDVFLKSYGEALTSIPFMLPMGVNLVLRIGFLGQDISHLMENLKVISEYFSKFQIRSFQLKLADSPSLPVYQVDKIYTAEEIAAADATVEEMKAVEKAKLAEQKKQEEAIFQAGLKELGFDFDEEEEQDAEPETSSKRPAPEEEDEEDEVEDKKTQKKTKKTKTK